MGIPTLEMTADDFEPFAVPEFFVTECVKREIIPGTGCVRLYYGTRRGNALRAEYSVVVPIKKLTVLAKDAQVFAAEAHNEVTFATLAELNGGMN